MNEMASALIIFCWLLFFAIMIYSFKDHIMNYLLKSGTAVRSTIVKQMKRNIDEFGITKEELFDE